MGPTSRGGAFARKAGRKEPAAPAEFAHRLRRLFRGQDQGRSASPRLRWKKPPAAVATCARLLPVRMDPDAMMMVIDPTALHPDGARMRTGTPVTMHPYPLTTPIPIAWSPDKRQVRLRRDDFLLGRRRRFGAGHWLGFFSGTTGKQKEAGGQWRPVCQNHFFHRKLYCSRQS